MSCDIVSGIGCIIYFLCKTAIIGNVKCITSLGYIICTIRIIITCFVSCNIIIEVITRCLYTVMFHLIAISNIITIVINMLS